MIAWRSAVLTRAKTIPSLDALMMDPDRRARPTQTLAQQLAIVAHLNAAMGGRDLRGSNGR